ncbi:GCN5-related N-acetyltransferase [Alkaliphilus metalliredigens QYMF]|uniref:GCN5-related N-acetyltransferase n=1 Tax=Alkaliphilus metalliredigens (strain QYMF) TaxID=293826 RepID=A6TLI7_ALKMQ|nr:GNAT family N-acetyltransferase [Alkaliphilus metalliredigens]ABR47055.1 GCN5-related N-acetyltransferase [Alkaliphilus metalliredigens QYMF]
MKIREFLPGDREVIQRTPCEYVSEVYFHLTKDGWNYFLEERLLDEKIQKEYTPYSIGKNNEGQMTFIIEEQDQLIGYMEMAYDQHRKLLQILNIYVTKEQRKKGRGKTLLKASKGYARFNKARGILMEIPNDNYPAIQLALKAGFEFTGIDEICYRRDGHKSQEVGLRFTFHF